MNISLQELGLETLGRVRMSIPKFTEQLATANAKGFVVLTATEKDKKGQPDTGALRQAIIKELERAGKTYHMNKNAPEGHNATAEYNIIHRLKHSPDKVVVLNQRVIKALKDTTPLKAAIASALK